ncbi:MAG: N-acetylmuramidase [Alphaproteobacteria bacterium CG_4_10_14_0_2_um_filter_63_37]|nr:MAG: hypothetical protein AUJ55_06810 [Proteobacteria bacterium CG1_02_64_396]PJA24717.1 MAG: N-acetylmuramidase [Alphaproteobacteria bacterium CG_4_10_14_0_2_um_filter_63_37]
MAEFAQALAATLGNEGGYVDDPHDAGGETCRGISRKNFPTWGGWGLIDQAKSAPGFPGGLDGNALLQEQIAAFYKGEFWDRVRGDAIADQQVAASIFDFAVNAGVGTSARLAQKAAGAAVDGAIGPNSVAAINGTDPRTFLALFALNKIDRYIQISENSPNNRTFFFGWIKRAMADAPV